MNNDKRRNEHEFNYTELLQMTEHAKKYDLTDDKKIFLKNISPYEQKLVLLESKNPYEVLKYLEELDLPNTKLILNELTTDEILRILELFTSEHKEEFYNNYSDLNLVNKFISNDKNAYQHVEDLDLDRKIEILNSSNSNTVEAASVVYDSISDNEKSEVIKNITTTEGSIALDSVSSYNEDITNENSELQQTSNESVQVELNNEEQNLIENDVTIQQADEQKQSSEENKEQEQLILEDNKEELLNQDNSQDISGFISKGTEKSDENLIPLELDESNNNLEMFQAEKTKAEQVFIASIINHLENENVNTNEKTL